MNRGEFIKRADEKLRLVRAEYELSQEKMAWELGLSKKTVIEIEKGRATLGWSGAVTMATIFVDSEILASTFGGRPTELISLIAFEGTDAKLPRTMGGKIWWKELDVMKGFRIQQNIISGHYRILNADNRLICSSFDFEEVSIRLKEVANEAPSGEIYETIIWE